jgi:hypothetical protein
MRLQNWCVEHNLKMPESEREQIQFDGQSAHWWDEAGGVRECVRLRQGIRSDLMHNSTLRDALTEILEDIGASRPPPL